MNWNDYYIEQAGGGDYNTFKGALYQRGYGLGGMFGRFIKWIIPLIKKSAGPLLKGAASALGSEAVTTATNIAKDAWAGKPISESFKKNAHVAIDNLKLKAENALSGKGIKRRRSMKKMIILKKRNNKRKKFEDIFNHAN